MRNKTAVCLAVGGLLALTAGCGKTQNEAPPTKETETANSATKAEPRPTAENLVSRTTNGVAATGDAAKRALETAVTPVREAAPKVVDATNPAPDKPQGVVIQAQPTLADLSQDQVVQGLKDALAKGLQAAISGLGHHRHRCGLPRRSSPLVYALAHRYGHRHDPGSRMAALDPNRSPGTGGIFNLAGSNSSRRGSGIMPGRIT